jgi:Ca-activated chloride channel homolog
MLKTNQISRAFWLVLTIVFFCRYLSGGDAAKMEVPAGQKFIVQLETDLNTRTTRKGDRVDFTTAADIMADNQPVIPSGSKVRGTVTNCKRAGRLSGNAQLNLKFDEILMSDGTALPLSAVLTRVGFDPVDPKNGGDPTIQGESGSGGDAKKVAKAGAQGAIIGVLTAGTSGAIYGGAAGAAIATIGLILHRGPDLDLPRSTMMEAQLKSPLQVPKGSVTQVTQLPPKRETPSPDMQSVPLEPEPESVPDDRRRATRPVLKRRPSEASVEASPPVPEPEVPVPAAKVPEGSSTGADFSVRVQMVLVDAVIRDKSGRMMETLKKEDFSVYEDDVLQELQSFSRDELPLAVAVLVDRSGSVAPYLSELRRIATRALQQLKPSDEVALFSFANTVDRLVDLTPDRRRIADAIAHINGGGSTNINDAIFECAAYLRRMATERRHAIIMVSDNQATVNSRAGQGEVIREVLETDTVLYSIKTHGVSDPLTIDLPSLILGGDDVTKIARESGGEVLNASSVSSLDSVLSAVISRLRTRYALGYAPSNPAAGVFHSITVRLTDKFGKPGKDYFVLSRRGYYSVTKK